MGCQGRLEHDVEIIENIAEQAEEHLNTLVQADCSQTLVTQVQTVNQIQHICSGDIRPYVYDKGSGGSFGVFGSSDDYG